MYHSLCSGFALYLTSETRNGTGYMAQPEESDPLDPSVGLQPPSG